MNDGTRDGRSGIRDAGCSRIALKHLWCKASVATSTRERKIWEDVQYLVDLDPDIR